MMLPGDLARRVIVGTLRASIVHCTNFHEKSAEAWLSHAMLQVALPLHHGRGPLYTVDHVNSYEL
jgi:hypothetical protein